MLTVRALEIPHLTFYPSQKPHSAATNVISQNYSQGLFESLDTLTDTSSWQNSTHHSEGMRSDQSLSSSSIGSPQAFSSPKNEKPNAPDKVPKQKPKYNPKRLTVLNMNCRLDVDKNLELKHLTDQTKPDIIAGTEF